MTDVIYLAPLCQEHERMWCEHDAPIDCECIDGPHPWIKYVAALRQPTQSDALLTKMNEWCKAVAVQWGQGSQTHNIARDAVDIVRAALQEQSHDR